MLVGQQLYWQKPRTDDQRLKKKPFGIEISKGLCSSINASSRTGRSLLDKLLAKLWNQLYPFCVPFL